MTIRIGSIRSTNSGGHGVSIIGNPDLHVDFISTDFNGKDGVNIAPGSVLDELGLPTDIDKNALAVMLERLSALPEQERASFIEEPEIWATLGTSAVATAGLVANLLSIADSPFFGKIVSGLSGS